MSRPTRSPDLNPIEQIWNILGKRLRDHPKCRKNSESVEHLLHEIWEKLDQNEIRSRSRGGNNPY